MNVPPRIRRRALLHEAHDVAGHFRRDSTFVSLTTNYWWPHVYQDVTDYVKTCHACQVFDRKNPITRPLNPILVSGLFEMWGLDFIGPITPESGGNAYILVATEYFTKWPVALATKVHDAATVAEFLYQHIFTVFGPPTHILTDRGTEFNNDLMKRLTAEAHVNHKLTTSYNPRCNGLTERFNKTLFAALEKCSEANPDTWHVHIPKVLWTYRTRIHSSLQRTPYELLFGMKYIKNPLQKKLATEPREVFATKSRAAAHAAATAKATAMKEFYDSKLRSHRLFHIGDMVLMYSTKLLNSHSRKTIPSWTGPYYVIKELPKGNYQLADMDHNPMKTAVNANRLKPYHQLE